MTLKAYLKFSHASEFETRKHVEAHIHACVLEFKGMRSYVTSMPRALYREITSRVSSFLLPSRRAQPHPSTPTSSLIIKTSSSGTPPHFHLNESMGHPAVGRPHPTNQLLSRRDDIGKFGIRLRKSADGMWALFALPRHGGAGCRRVG